MTKLSTKDLTRLGPQLAMISLMKYGGIWERLGLEVSRMDLERRALNAEDELLDGRCNMIFGCHITTRWRVAHGVPMICMAQTVNTAQDMLVSTKPLAGVNDLKGSGFGRTGILRP